MRQGKEAAFACSFPPLLLSTRLGAWQTLFPGGARVLSQRQLHAFVYILARQMDSLESI